MANNYLVTGLPRSGKTTVVERTVDRLDTRGYRAGGIVCPELREEGERVGFEVVDFLTGDAATLASVDREEGPAVGKYRVNVPGLERVARRTFRIARADADYVVVDEIAPMELHSDAFREGVRAAMDDDRPVLAAIHHRSTEGLIGELKAREDVERFEVTPEDRESLPERLAERVVDAL